MEVILLEKVAQLGDPGDLVNVKAGYGRNFLIPSGKAVRADEKNKAEYEKRREALLSAEADRKESALVEAEKMQSLSITISAITTSLSSFGFKEQRSFDKTSGSIGITKPGK